MAEPHSICVYCGSSPGVNPAYAEKARILGRRIAENGMRLVYGGGTRGLMGAVAAGALEAGGKVLGIIPRFLVTKEASAAGLNALTELIVVDNMHQRKHALFENSDAFIALPGGIGTVEEIVEVMTWAQLGKHEKPMVFANINQFWQPMLTMIEHMKGEGFIHSGHLMRPLVIDQVEDILPAILRSAKKPNSKGDAEIIDRL